MGNPKNFKMKCINEIKKFEVRHKIIFFLIVMGLTILISRFLTSILDPNIIIKNFEVHHFYYGLILLIITSLMMLYKKGNFKIFLPLTAISIGLIIDELIFIGTKTRGQIQYNTTFTSTIILAIIIMLIIEVIYYYKSKK